MRSSDHRRAVKIATRGHRRRAAENGPDLSAGGDGVGRDLLSLGKSVVRISTPVCIVTGGEVASPKKAMMRPRMVSSSRVGALGRGRGTGLAAPAPIANLELGPMLIWRRLVLAVARSSARHRLHARHARADR